MKIKSKLLDALRLELGHLMFKKRQPGPKCNECDGTGKIPSYDQAGNIESESRCQACDKGWRNANIAVREMEIERQIKMIKKAHLEALRSVGMGPKRRKKS